MPTLRRNLNEEAFEKYVQEVLIDLHVYRKRDSGKHYKKENALDPELLFEFLKKTQAEKMKRLKEIHGDLVEEKLLERIDGEIKKRGLVDVLRKGISQGPITKIDLIYFKPNTSMNPDLIELYKSNIFSVMRQVYYSETCNNSLDIVLFVNGIPISTAELKNEVTGQTVRNAMSQYRTDRDPREKIFSFKRCAAHFAIDTSEIFLTTKIDGYKTFFLPFNRGHNNGAGNPPTEGKHKTSYLWEDTWSPDSWLDLLQNFVHVFKEERENQEGEKYEVEVQVFPRFHQRDTVLRAVSDVAQNRVGKNYLIQHSAGSGKSMTIAWMAYRMSELHDNDNNKIFDGVFVLTDRRTLDKQLRKTVEAFESTQGVLTSVREDVGRSKSEQLKEAIESGSSLITTTIQTFPFVADIIDEFPGKNFALIVDEAHSSQGGETTRAVNEVLAGRGEESVEDFILKQVQSRIQPETISYFAFTATPKQTTLQNFGEKQEDGSFKPFSLYSMKQAIEEKFIIDVLLNYTTYKRYFKLLKKIPDNPELPRNRALSAIRRYVDLHPETIEQKIEIIVNHFEATVRELINSEAKAMIVTRSRESAVRYKLAIDAYLRDQNYSYKSLVAFSDSINIDGVDHTEASMNGVPEAQTVNQFNKPNYKFLIVAEKYQTGFDQPLLSAMYVDKKLAGVEAVQTLSRLNRKMKDKEQVFVLDFVNTTDEIKEAFEPYYIATVLSEGIDENILNDTKREIYEIYTIKEEDLNEFVEIIHRAHQDDDLHKKVNGYLDKHVEDVMRLEEDSVERFKAKSSFFVSVYPFTVQVFKYTTPELESLYLFLKYLTKKLPKKGRSPLDITEYIDLKNVASVKKQKEKKIELDGQDGDIYIAENPPDGGTYEGGLDALENIVSDANREWGAEFGKKQVETLNDITNEFVKDEKFNTSVKANPERKKSVAIKFEEMFIDKVHDKYESDQELWEQLNNNEDLRKYVGSKMFDYVFKKILKEPYVMRDE
jgi:type I restriction enzyme, R subunit